MAIIDKLQAIGNAVRLKRGIDTPMTLDDLVTQIGLIGAKIDGGSINLTANSNNYTIQHNLGEIPDLIVIACSGLMDGLCLKHIIYSRIPRYPVENSVQSTSSNSSNANTYSSTVIDQITESSFRYYSPNQNRYIAAGDTYHWIALKWVD